MQMSGDPHGPRPTLPGAQLTKQSAGLSAWRHQKGAEERPFLNTLSIGILSLWTKSEFGAGRCCVQWPEQNERGDRVAFFQSMLLPQDARALDSFPG